MKKWRDWVDFIEHAKKAYGRSILNEKEIEGLILKKLQLKGLSPITVTCYINWCDNEFFTQSEIAARLKITQQAVADHIYRLRKVWPFLPSHPHAKGQLHARQRSKDFSRMTRLKKKTFNVAKIRETW